MHVEQTFHILPSNLFRRQGKDKGPSSEPVVLEDAAADEEGNPLPRVVVFSPTPTVAVPGDNRDDAGNGKPDAAIVSGQVRCHNVHVKARQQLAENLCATSARSGCYIVYLACSGEQPQVPKAYIPT